MTRSHHPPPPLHTTHTFCYHPHMNETPINPDLARQVVERTLTRLAHQAGSDTIRLSSAYLVGLLRGMHTVQPILLQLALTSRSDHVRPLPPPTSSAATSASSDAPSNPPPKSSPPNRPSANPPNAPTTPAPPTPPAPAAPRTPPSRRRPPRARPPRCRPLRVSPTPPRRQTLPCPNVSTLPPPLHRPAQWLDQHRPEILAEQIALCQIPAPTGNVLAHPPASAPDDARNHPAPSTQARRSGSAPPPPPTPHFRPRSDRGTAGAHGSAVARW